MSGPYEPTPDERRVIAWLRKESGLTVVAGFIVALTRAAHFIEQGYHHDQ